MVKKWGMLIAGITLTLSTSIFAALNVSFVNDIPLIPIQPNTPQSSVISQVVTIPLLAVSTNELVLTPLPNSTPTQNIELAVIGKILNYPNPFSYSSGQTEIGYRLSKAADLTLKIYTLRGQIVYSQDITSTDYGRASYNKVPFSKSVMNGNWLAPGTYLYLLIHDGKVIAKNRMVIVP